MNRSWRRWLAVLANGCVVAGAGCRGPEAAGTPQVRAVGRVVKVSEADRYVILECGLAPAVGTVAELRNDGLVTARIRVTAMRRGAFVAADILDGQPSAGDVLETAAPWAPEAGP